MQSNQEKSNPIMCYKDLQKQLNDEHQRLLRQREQMLSRQNERLQLYQKLDLVQFFNYSPQKEESKQKMMYHLSKKFKDYMRKLTQNNVYKRQSYLVNGRNHSQTQNQVNLFISRTNNQQNKSIQGEKVRERSLSSKSRRSNVQRNSDLGRMFQTMRYYQQQYQSQSYPKQMQYQKHKTPRQSVYGKSQFCSSNIDNNINSRGLSASRKQNKKFDKLNELNTLDKTSHQEKSLINKNFVQTEIKKKLFPQTQIGLQIEQLKSALAQQQKIYLLTQLNHYIKLFKQSQIKKNFLQKHLQNLHQFILQIKPKYYKTQKHSKSKSKSKSKYQFTPYLYENKQNNKQKENYLEKQNQMLKKQLQIYLHQLNTINKFTNQDYSSSQKDRNFSFLQTNKIHQSPKCTQVKKIDRFKQFAQHIHIMQNQLINLANKVNAQQLNGLKYYTQNPNNSNQFLINQLKNKIVTLENTIQRQELKKQQFFQEVKKFKQVMNNRNEEINRLKNELKISESSLNQLKRQKEQLLAKNKQSRSTYRNSQLNNALNQKQDISQFINRTMKSPQKQFNGKRQFRYSQVTTNSPSDFQSRNSRVQSNSSKYEFQILNKKHQQNQNTNALLIDQNNLFQNSYYNDSYKRANYHQKNQPSPLYSRNSRSKSKYSLRSDSKNSYRSKSKTDYLDSYQPKPYERYNKLQNYQTHQKPYQNIHPQNNPLYQRINDNH